MQLGKLIIYLKKDDDEIQYAREYTDVIKEKVT